MGRRIFLMLLVILGWKVEAVMSLWCLGLPSPSRIIPRLPLLAPGCIFHAFIPATCSLLLKCRHWFRRHGLTAFAMRTLEQSKQTGKAAIGIKPDTSKNFPMMPCNLKAQQREHAPSPPSPPWHESSRIPKSSTTGDLLPTRAMSKVSAPSPNNCLPRHFPRDSHNPFLFPNALPAETGGEKPARLSKSPFADPAMSTDRDAPPPPAPLYQNSKAQTGDVYP